jgi:protein transport protein SEC39
MNLRDLSADQCILLAKHYISESNIHALRIIVSARHEAFTPELILQLLLTQLPESADPSIYSTFIQDVANDVHSEYADGETVDTAPVQELSESKARAYVKHLHLLPLTGASCPPSEDALTRFLVYRAHRMDDAGLLFLVPHLLDSFADRSEFLRTWFISNVLPLLRLGYEYYPGSQEAFTLEGSEVAGGEKGVSIWLSKTLESTPDSKQNTSTRGEADESRHPLARDMKGLVGPWMYGYNQRKRRRLDSKPRRASLATQAAQDFGRLGFEGYEEMEANHDWEHAFTWLARTASERFPVVAEAIEEWNGPADVDLGGFDDRPYLDAKFQRTLQLRYVQTVFSTIYAASTDTSETVSSAHSVLVRIAQLMDYEPPPDLATSIDLLPRIDAKKSVIEDLPTSMLDPEVLLRPGHPLTTPKRETFLLLQMFVYSAYMFAELGHRMSVIKAAKIRFQLDAEEQSNILHKILHSVSTGPRKDEQQWVGVRSRMLWLWGWGLQAQEYGCHGYGIFGKVERSVLEKDFLKVLLSAACYPLIIGTYIKSSDTGLSSKEVEEVVISSTLKHYDNASNGNRTRGEMKKASEMISTLKQYFPKAVSFQQTEALLAATHSLSFYSLTLQHGVPFLPVNIRVSSDPITLIEKVLAQNPRSYTHLDDLISIGKNLVAAAPLEHSNDGSHLSSAHLPKLLESAKRKAERRVIGMAIEAALNEDDFETAYSYVVNRLDTSSAANGNSVSQPADQDDISWRAALAAGRHKSSTSSSSFSASTSLSTPPTLRRLEQRMELLSQALLLAPSTALPEVLNVWRKCEEEMTSLLARETEEDEAFNDRADRQLPGAFVNATVQIQPRREVGRGANEEAPMGLFDVARGAAAAFSRSAFPLRQEPSMSSTQAPSMGGGRVSLETPRSPSSQASFDMTSSGELERSGSGGRVRKRDMIAGAASGAIASGTGALASGLGWMLGEYTGPGS